MGYQEREERRGITRAGRSLVGTGQSWRPSVAFEYQFDQLICLVWRVREEVVITQDRAEYPFTNKGAPPWNVNKWCTRPFLSQSEVSFGLLHQSEEGQDAQEVSRWEQYWGEFGVSESPSSLPRITAIRPPGQALRL